VERFWHLRAFRRYWWVVIASIVVAMAAAVVVTKAGGDPGPPRTTYEATTKLFNSDATVGGFQVRGGGVTDPDLLLAFLESTEVAEAAADELGFEGTTAQLNAMVEGAVVEGTSIVEITATSTRPQHAEQVSRAYADALLVRLSDFQHEQNLEQLDDVELDIRILRDQIAAAEASEDDQAGQASGTDLDAELVRKRAERDALLDPNPDIGWEVLSSETTAQPIETIGFSAPRSLPVRLAIALVLGLLAGLAIALVMGRVDTRIRTKRGAEEAFGLPVLSEIPVLPRRARAELITSDDPTSRFAEGFRILGAELVRGPRSRRRDGEGDGRVAGAPSVLVVTSAGPAEGKTTVAANLAVALADMERTVIVLSCDFRRPKIHALFGVSPTPGLAETLGEADDGGPILDRVAVPTKIPGVRLVPSGQVRAQPTELLNSPVLRRVIDEAREAADVVIIDTTPILAVSDAAFVAPQADAVLLVARSGRTTVEVAERTTELLARLGCPAIGVALNRAAETVLPKGYRAYYERRPEWASANAANGDGRREADAETAADDREPVKAATADDDEDAALEAPAVTTAASGGDSPTSRVTREEDRV
jgi:capsular exopolysaccharide synthesis family protein